ncbi:MAG: NUDIX hydrolase [Thiotrichales bacterium]|nr:NUDIX hydrolase [Thiotrichales bacterium]
MADDEIVAIVDEENRLVDALTRLEMRSRRLIHRATYVLVFNSADELFVQKRTTIKDMYPGYYDLAAGGVVLNDESYQLSAEREAAEELGIRQTPIEHCFDFFYEDDLNRIWGAVFKCVYDGEFVLQPEEVESGRFMSVDAVRNGEVSPVTPDSEVALEHFLSL